MENKKQKPHKPPLSRGRIAREILAGAVGAIFGMAPVLLMLYQEAKYGAPSDGWEDLPYVLAFFLTYPLGALITVKGVYLVGKLGNQTGSFWATFAGSFLGLAVAVATIPLLFLESVARCFDRLEPASGPVLFAIFFAGPPLGAVIGFNLTRRYKSPLAS